MDFDRAKLMTNITVLIKEKGLRIGELESRVGISAGYISKMTKAENESMPGVDLIFKLAQELEVSVEALVCGDFNKSNDNLLFLMQFLRSLEEDINIHRDEWRQFADYDELRIEYDFPALPMLTRTLEVNMQEKVSSFRYVSEFRRNANLTVTDDNFYAFVSGIGPLLLFRLENHLPEGRKTEFELYAINMGSSDEQVIPMCSSLDSDGEIAPYLMDLHNCLLRHSKDIQISEETRSLINGYLRNRDPSELPFN